MQEGVLFLDDSENRTAAFLLNAADATKLTVKTAVEAIAALSEPWRIVHLDHDLGGEVYVDSGREDCGMEVVRHMVANQCDVGLVIVHTWNIPAGERMVTELCDAGYRAIGAPWGQSVISY